MARPVLSLAAASLGLTLLAACSTGPTGGSPAGGADEVGATSAGSSGAFPVTVEHAFGSTTVERDPQRVVTVGWSDHDVLVALGEQPVGATRITWGGNEEGSTDWFDAALTELGGSPEDVTRFDDSDGIPVDEIAALQPDLILGTNSGLDEAQYEQLSSIAPVVAYPEVAWGTPWRESVELVGEATGRQEEAAKVIADTEAAIDDAVTEYPQLEGTSMAWTWFTPSDLSTIGVYTSLDLRAQLMRELGMVDAPAVAELSEGNASFSANLSAEQADTLDADVVFAYVEDESQLQDIVGDPLVGQVPALAEGSYVAVTDMPLVTAMSSPTPLSIPVVLEDFLPLAGEAVEQAR